MKLGVSLNEEEIIRPNGIRKKCIAQLVQF
jgi:hypothetical protein